MGHRPRRNRRLQRRGAALCALLLLLGVPRVAEAVPDDVTLLLRQYETAWESLDVFALLALAPEGAAPFDELLDDKRLDRIVESAVSIQDISVTPHDKIEDARILIFTRAQEDVYAEGLVTRGVARIEAIVREDVHGEGLRFLAHRVVPFESEAEGAVYRSTDPSTWGAERAPAETSFYLGYRRLQQGDCAGALRRLEPLVAAATGDGTADLGFRYETGQERFYAQVCYFAALCELRGGERARAVELVRRAVELNKAFPLALNFLAERALDGNDLGAAIGLWTQSLEVNPDQPEVEAKREFHEKARLHYTDPDERALYLSIRGLPPSKAAQRLARLARQSQAEPETRRRLAICYLESMQPEKARRALTDNDYLHPHDLETQYLLARTYLAMQRLDDAAAVLGRVWARAPGYRDTEVLLAEVFAALGRYADAVGVLQEALTLRPHSPETLYKLASYSVRLGRRAEARRYLLRASEQHPPSSIRRAVWEALRTW